LSVEKEPSLYHGNLYKTIKPEYITITMNSFIVSSKTTKGQALHFIKVTEFHSHEI